MIYKREDDLVSVIITNYNNEKYIDSCLDSILNQSYKNIEIILVNDESADNSIKVIHKWITENKHSFTRKDFITVIDLPRNVGFSGAVTVGLFSCKGEFIAFQDGDDISHLNRIEKQVDFLKENPNINSVGTNYSIFTDTNPVPVFKPNGIVWGVDKIKNIYSKGDNCVCYGTLLIRGEIFDKIGGFSRKLELVEDYEYITKLLPFGLNNLGDILYYYRKHEKQRSRGLYNFKNKPNDPKEFKVMLTLDKLNIGGTETHVLSLAKGLIDKGIKVVVLANDGPLGCEFENLNCKIYNIDFPLEIIKDLDEKANYEDQIKEIIKDEQINIVHAHQSPSGALCIDVCKQLKIPCVFTIHGLYYQDIVFNKLKQAQEVISVSQPVSQWLSTFNISSTIVPNFIDFDTFSDFDISNDIRKNLNINKDSFVILYCSRLAWGKTIVAENLIRVCRDIRRLENLDVHALIIGDGPDLQKIETSCERANKILNDNYIHVLGPKTKLSNYYSSCDCVVGTGRVAIEAMACCKPIIASGNQGYFGILNNKNLDKSWEIYFGDHKSERINNASYLYKDLTDMISNKDNLESLSVNCNQWAKNKFDTKVNIESIIKIYQSAVDKTDYFAKNN